MTLLTIRLSRKPDGTTVLVCTRQDGSQTWQRHQRYTEFFPHHDLMHYAVETTLGLRHGFYGLLADGWNITDFGEREIPSEAILAETIVGLLDGERANGQQYDADGFGEALIAALAQQGHRHERQVTGKELEAIRERWQELAGRWATVPVGKGLEIDFG